MSCVHWVSWTGSVEWVIAARVAAIEGLCSKNKPHLPGHDQHEE